MKNKYYTPDVSEFYVGFEYEVNEDTTENPGWVKQTYMLDYFIYPEFDDYGIDTSELRDGYIRVKYLDKEDIESLGFYEDEKYQSTVDESNSDWHYDYGMKSKNKKLRLIYTNWRTYGSSKAEEIDYSNYNEYSVVKIVKSVIGGEQFTAFVGFIKNKSELKQILKMIGYDYSN